MTDPALQRAFAEDVVFLRYAGLKPVVVHGGGPQITAHLDRLGIADRVPRRAAGHHPRGDGRRPDGAGRPGQRRRGRPDQRPRPVRGRHVRRGRAACSPPSRGRCVVDGEEVDIGLVGDVVAVDPGALTGAARRRPDPGGRDRGRRRGRPVLQRQRRHRGRRARGRAGRAEARRAHRRRGAVRAWRGRPAGEVVSEIDADDAGRAAARAVRRAWCRRWRPACGRCAAASRRRTCSTGGCRTRCCSRCSPTPASAPWCCPTRRRSTRAGGAA